MAVAIGDWVECIPPIHASDLAGNHVSEGVKVPECCGRVVGRISADRVVNEEGVLIRGLVKVTFMAAATGSLREETMRLKDCRVVLKANGDSP